MHTPVWGPVLGLLFNALVFGVSWWPLREMQALGLHPLWSMALMYGLAFGFVRIVQPQAWRDLWRHPTLWWLFLASGLTNVGFNWAVTLGDVVRVVLLFYTMPAWSILLAWWLLGERPTRMALLRLALALVGVALVLKTPDMAWPLPSTPYDFLALLGGASFALNNVILRKMAHVPDASRMSAMFAGGTVITALTALAGVPMGLVTFPADLAWWPYVLGFGVCMLASNLSLQYGIARMSAATSSLVMLSEIVFAVASSVALGAAELSERKLLGGLLIVLAAVLATMPTRPKENP
jgi:drug/metabolite transporter (DMT)-like permease